MIHLWLSRKSNTALILWTLWLLLLPFPGILLYWFLGNDRIRKKRLEQRKRRQFAQQREDGDRLEATVNVPAVVESTANIPGNVLSGMRDLKFLFDSEAYYEHLLKAIANARHHVHFQTFVWREDATGDLFLLALVDAAKRGVKVRLLVDEIGSMKTRSTYFRPLQDAGGEFSWSTTVHPRRNRYFINLRNHRKLQIIDGEFAYSGGMNIGDEYRGRVASIGDWRDLFFVTHGPVVSDLQDGFLDDWFFATARSFDTSKCFQKQSAEGCNAVAIIWSGPDNLHFSFQKSFLNLCNTASKSLDLFTPYFAPDHSIVLAIQLAVIRGVRVRIMIPSKNEHQYMIDIGRAYYESLMEAGVEIYEYPHAVIHSKVYIADEETILVGSPNLDIRSIRLNFELAILFKDRELVRPLVEEYAIFWQDAERVDLEVFLQRPFKQRLREGAIRLIGPIL